MGFEYDSEKSVANKRKHGIDFEEAQALWTDENYIEIPAKNPGEERVMIIGMILDRYWSAIITHRNNNIRLISVRRAREEKIEIYETF